jgi:hypothetical protein
MGFHAGVQGTLGIQEEPVPKNRALHMSLAMLAVVGLSLFILACTGWLSWSPDGSQIVFGYYDVTAQQFRIAIYDSGSGKARALNPKEFSLKDKWLSAQWKRDGSALFVFKALPENKMAVMEVDATTGEVIRSVEVPVTGSDTALILPAIETGGALFLDTDPITRIDLATMEFEQRDSKQYGFICFIRPDRIVYVTHQDNSTNYEFGLVDPQTMAKNYLFTISTSDPRFRGAEELGDFIPASAPNGSRFALPSRGETQDKVVLINDTGVEKVFTPVMPFKKFHLGSMEWSQDGRHLYAGVISPSTSKTMQYSVAEIDTESGEANVFSVVELKANFDSDFKESFAAVLQVWLSPDGQMIATSTANMAREYIDEKDRALYLLNPGDDKNSITRILPPVTKKKKVAKKAK